MSVPLIFAALFLLGALANTFGPWANLAEALAGYAIALYLFEVWRLVRRHARRLDEFHAWLVENREALRSGAADLDGIPIDEQTELTQYETAMSFLLVGVTARSRYYRVGHDSGVFTALTFTVCSLALGWWEFPWGPIKTVGALATNLRGGRRSRVGDVLDELFGHEKAVVQLTPLAAENALRIMAERGFRPGSAMQVEVDGDPGFHEYRVTYDESPDADGSVWMSESHGVTIVVRKRDEPRLAGLTVDFDGGDFVFRPPAAPSLVP